MACLWTMLQRIAVTDPTDACDFAYRSTIDNAALKVRVI